MSSEIAQVQEKIKELNDALKTQFQFQNILGKKGFVPEEVDPVYKEKLKKLDEIRKEIGNCKRCVLSLSRTKIVFGEGNPNAKVVFVGEAPGKEEDESGRPFVGSAGRILTNIIEKGMKLNRSDVYICNVIKCRPPENRNPMEEEMEACEKFLMKQLDIIKPRVIVALGKFSSQRLIRTQEVISKLRGKVYDYKGIPLVPTYHPGYLLRNPSEKREVWKDIKKVLEILREE